MTNNPYAKIKANAIMTASPQELTLMLYDGAIKFGNQAKLAMGNGEVENAHNLIMRVQAIIEEFQATLDMRFEVSEGMALMYDYILRRLMEANFKKDPEILEEAIAFIRELRNTWKEAMQLVKQPTQDIAESINLTSQAQ
jgi:flagellar protein FliS